LELDALKSLLSLCRKGDIQAIRTFQDVFGEDIYNFPMKVHKLDEQRASDFYCYCFEGDRIYKRFNTFRGECNIRSFQFLILESLFNEWIRRLDVEATIYPLQGSEEWNELTVVEDIRQDPLPTPNEKIEENEELNGLDATMEKLVEVDRVYLKVLSFSEIDLEPKDIRAISRVSGNNLQKTLENITELEESLSKRYERYKKQREELDKINYWILTYEKRIKKQMDDKFTNIMEVENQDHNKNELERKLLWRKKQKKKLLMKYRESSPKVSYREIAKLLDVSVGTVSSRIKNAKAKLNDSQCKEQQI
jgi:RNA polymerase sigma factor (sigma-70 family)